MNVTWNGSSCSSGLNPTAYKLGATIACCLIFVVSLIGNSCIGITFYRTKTLRKPINIFIVNMAISDLLTSLVFIIRNITTEYFDSWYIRGAFDKALCKIPHVLSDISWIVSIESLVLIAVDRFEAVVFPLRSQLINSNRCPFLIFSTWVLATAVTLPLFFGYIRNEEVHNCFSYWNDFVGESSWMTMYLLALYVVFIYAPIILLIILYSFILIKLKSEKIPGEQSTHAEKQRVKRNRNVLKMAIAIVLGFIICWIPSSVDYLLRFVIWTDSLPPCGFNIYSETVWFLVASYCVVNPCICFTLSRNYREGLKRLFKCLTSASYNLQ